MSDYRVLIADDEPIECLALEIILKNFAGVEVLPMVHNGVDLISSIRSNEPDVVIVDINMPGMSGLDALDLVWKSYPEMKTVIHSAYSEFTFAKRAFAVRAEDYIVKPVQKQAFIVTMQKIFDDLDRERMQKQTQEQIHTLTGEVSHLVENDIMSSILLGEIDVRCENLFLRSLGREYPGGFFVTITPGASFTGRRCERLLEVLREESTCFSRRFREELLLFIVPEGGIGEDSYVHWIRGYFQNVQDSFLFGISRWKFTVGELPDARRESESILMGKKAPGIYVFSYCQGTFCLDAFGRDRERILSLYRQGSTQEVGRLIRENLLSAAEQGTSLEILQIQAACLVFTLYEKGNRDYTLYQDGIMRGIWDVLPRTVSVEALWRELENALRKMEEREEEKGGHTREYVLKALLTIRESYAQNLCVEDVAEQVGISSFYLSRLLKQELGETFVEILTRVRIHKAICLLADSSLSIQEIGERTGYANTTYFYKVFKKQTGKTVGEVRRALVMEEP